MVELHLHGGPVVQAEVMKELLGRGCRQALPGEFSFRAVRNGKLTLDQAQGVRDLIESSSRSAQLLAMERLGGHQARAFEAQAEVLRQVLTLAEAGIDFSDQEIDELELARLSAGVAPVVRFLEDLEQTFERGSKIRDGVSVVLAGLPNAGKSTLFNELLGVDRSLISEEAGTTRDILREPLRIPSPAGDSDFAILLHDTAGLRGVAGHVETMGIERTLEASGSADLVVFVAELGCAIRPVLAEWERMKVPATKACLVVSKAESWSGDPGQRSWRQELESAIGVRESILVSAMTRQGVGELISEIARHCARLSHRAEGEVVLTRADQQDAVRKARECLVRATRAEGHDLFSADIRQALDHLSFFIGKTPSEEILGRIFSQFCIGK